MKRTRVLVIDDDLPLLEVLCRRLAMANYDVQSAADGGEGIRKFDGQAFEVVVTDLRMPRVNGLEVVKHVKARAPETVTIVLTGFATLESAVEVMHHGCDEYLLKPLSSLDLLCQSIERCLARRAVLVKAASGQLAEEAAEEVMAWWLAERNNRMDMLEQSASADEVAGGGGGPLHAESTRRILVVDDDGAFRDMLAWVFLERGCDVTTADAGRKALDLVLKGQFHAMVIDRMLSDADGLDVVRSLRRAGARIPVLVLSGDPGCGTGDQLAGLEPAAALCKPASMKDILAAVDGLMGCTATK
jgi:DNA-binding response OmpR family regulator